MNDYIERNKALNELCLNHRDVIYIDKQEAAARIRAIPKEDVVKVVRCKDCKHIFYLGSGTMGDVICRKHDIQVSRNSHCSFGEGEV